MEKRGQGLNDEPFESLQARVRMLHNGSLEYYSANADQEMDAMSSRLEVSDEFESGLNEVGFWLSNISPLEAGASCFTVELYCNTTSTPWCPQSLAKQLWDCFRNAVV